MTELSYGYVVDAFQFAYALGLLAAGRFVDKVGTRIGYMVIMAVWSLSAMGHALANTVMEFGIARFSPRPRRIRQLSRSHQNRGRVVPAE